MANEIIVLQIMFIALGMVLFSAFFNKLFGLKLEDMKELQERGFNLQERMRNAQALGDSQMMADLQSESIELMKIMMKKQLLPMSARCIVFMVIFFVLGIFYAPYDFWYLTYFLFSLLFSFSAMGIKYAYKRITNKEDKTKSMARELKEMFIPNRGETQSLLHYSDSIPYRNNPENAPPRENHDSWKDRLS